VPILKTTATPTGVAVGWHRPGRVEIDLAQPHALVHVLSWPSEQQVLDGAAPAWSWPVELPLAGIDGANLVASIEAGLVALEGSPMEGGQISAPVGDLAAAKVRRMAQILAQRDLALAGGFTWDGSAFDSQPADRMNVIGASVAALGALSAQTPLSIDWTLADNSVRTLSAADVWGLGQALLAHVATQHATARPLRAAIEAAQTVEEVLAVAWP
jgi:hypothetical protein